MGGTCSTYVKLEMRRQRDGGTRRKGATWKTHA